MISMREIVEGKIPDELSGVAWVNDTDYGKPWVECRACITDPEYAAFIRVAVRDGYDWENDEGEVLVGPLPSPCAIHDKQGGAE